MRVAVVGGGINGVMTAWAFARRGNSVDLFEKGRLMSATSRSSTKMLRGGLRYLEHGHPGLVREALQERRIGNPMGFRDVWLTPGAAVNCRFRAISGRHVSRLTERRPKWHLPWPHANT